MDTTWARLPLSVRLRELFSERLYQPTAEEEFSAIMQHLAAVNFETSHSSILARARDSALFCWRRCIPLRTSSASKYSPLWMPLRSNIERFAEPGQQCRNIESICADAREYDFPAHGYCVVSVQSVSNYVLREVLSNLVASARSAPRQIFVLYNAPFEKQEFDRIPEFERYS